MYSLTLKQDSTSDALWGNVNFESGALSIRSLSKGSLSIRKAEAANSKVCIITKSDRKIFNVSPFAIILLICKGGKIESFQYLRSPSFFWFVNAEKRFRNVVAIVTYNAQCERDCDRKSFNYKSIDCVDNTAINLIISSLWYPRFRYLEQNTRVWEEFSRGLPPRTSSFYTRIWRRRAMDHSPTRISIDCSYNEILRAT